MSLSERAHLVPHDLGRTATDVANTEVALDAQHQLRRCKTEADYAAWAARWGDALVFHALNRKV